MPSGSGDILDANGMVMAKRQWDIDALGLARAVDVLRADGVVIPWVLL